jgi:putative transposon-encoded protein
MKDEADLPTDVHIENVEKIFIKKVKRLGNISHVSVHKRYIGREIVFILTMSKNIKAKKDVQI